LAEELGTLQRLIITGCGSAYYAGLVGAHILRQETNISVEVVLASELRYRPWKEQGTGVLAISQSGETADTIAAMSEARKQGLRTFGLINVPGSTLARLVDTVAYTQAGPEIAVASTKAFTAQVAALLLLGSRLRGEELLSDAWAHLPADMTRVIQQQDHIRRLARRYREAHHFLVLGRGYQYPVACEAALKIKEVSYVHAEGMAAGEMKHGSLALIDNHFPSLFLAARARTHAKLLSNMQEVKARGGPIVAIATEGDEDVARVADDVIFVPVVPEDLAPLLTIIPAQLLAYYLALDRGFNVDQPRNLAKSVTVE
jgi:glucosamine--fructose-6-phosphate aminotransferase (isomerizing)